MVISLKRKDNRGFTLLELIVAVAILAVIIAPLLHSFLTSANATRKARATDMATNAVTNLIEEVKAQRSIADFLEHSVGSNVSAGVLDEATGVVTFEVTNYAYGTRVFEGRIILTPTPYKKADPSDPDKINDQEFVKYSANGIKYGMDNNSAIDLSVLNEVTLERASYDADADYQTAYAAWLSGGSSGAAPVPNSPSMYMNAALYSSMLATLERAITYNILDEGTNILVECTMEYSSTYTDKSGASHTFAKSESMSALSYPKDSAIHLFYYPLYGAKKDAVVVNNNPGRSANVDVKDLQIFLVKQRMTSDTLLGYAKTGTVAVALKAADDAYMLNYKTQSASFQHTLQQHYGANRATLSSNVALSITALTVTYDDFNYANNTTLHGGVINELTKLPSSLVEHYKNTNRMYDIIIELTDTMVDGQTISMTASKLLFPDESGN